MKILIFLPLLIISCYWYLTLVLALALSLGCWVACWALERFFQLFEGLVAPIPPRPRERAVH